MAEAEFISELLLAIKEGIREGQKGVIDNCYRKYDDDFPSRRQLERRFRETMDVIGEIVGTDLPELAFRATRLFYPLFCAVYHLKFGLPRLRSQRVALRASEYPKLKTVLEKISETIETIKAAEEAHQDVALAAEERKFYDAFRVHWVHVENRTILTEYICRQFAKALKA